MAVTSSSDGERGGNWKMMLRMTEAEVEHLHCLAFYFLPRYCYSIYHTVRPKPPIPLQPWV